MASMGLALTFEQYVKACSMVGVDPKVGIDANALAALYDKGMADLDKDFDGLQEELDMKAYDNNKSSCPRHPSWRPCNEDCRAYQRQDMPSKRKCGTARTRRRRSEH